MTGTHAAALPGSAPPNPVNGSNPLTTGGAAAVPDKPGMRRLAASPPHPPKGRAGGENEGRRSAPYFSPDGPSAGEITAGGTLPPQTVPNVKNNV